MTDKEKLEKVKAEIERRYNYHKDHADDYAGTEHFWKADEDRGLLSFIDSMPKRQVYILKGEIKDAPIADTGDYEVFLDYCRDEYEDIIDKICDYVNEKYPNDIDRYKVTIQITIDKED